MPIQFAREVAGFLEAGLRREWLVVDGTGGYAMGTVAGGLTRSYHGLLVAALAPPLGRTTTVAQMVEGLTTPAGRLVHLHTQEWRDGSVDPRGFELIEDFRLEGTIPVWRFSVDGALLEKRLWMPRERAAATFVVYRLLRAPADASVTLSLRPLCTWRDHHTVGAPAEAPEVEVSGAGIVLRFRGARAVHVRASGGSATKDGDWYRGFHLRTEKERGLPAVQDLYAAGRIEARLQPGDALAVTLAVHEPLDARDWEASLSREQSRQQRLVDAARLGRRHPPWVAQMVLAADQFALSGGGRDTVIAGYPWFGDWGRDTFISLPGLALATGRSALAASWLRSFVPLIDRGLIPNRFPEGGAAPEYNTADATLWYVEALRAYVYATGDEGLVDELWPALEEIVGWHLSGTRHGIGVDPTDSLLRAGEPGVQLTWMDAMVDGQVVSPRIGKPVEVNALWHNALRILGGWAQTRRSRHDHAAHSSAVAAAFDRFWNAEKGYAFDVVDGPDGDDATVRPNAVIAASLPHTPFSEEQVAAIVAVAERELVTSLGLRSLARTEPKYTARYSGDQRARDFAYHEGTVWPWLLGPLVTAHLRVHRDPAAAASFLEPLSTHLGDAGLGSVSEIADAEPPHTPRGCPWQAWSVAEPLRAWRLCAGASSTSR